jgi:hypothetical protein
MISRIINIVYCLNLLFVMNATAVLEEYMKKDKNRNLLFISLVNNTSINQSITLLDSDASALNVGGDVTGTVSMTSAFTSTADISVTNDGAATLTPITNPFAYAAADNLAQFQAKLTAAAITGWTITALTKTGLGFTASVVGIFPAYANYSFAIGNGSGGVIVFNNNGSLTGSSALTITTNTTYQQLCNDISGNPILIGGMDITSYINNYNQIIQPVSFNLGNLWGDTDSKPVFIKVNPNQKQSSKENIPVPKNFVADGLNTLGYTLLANQSVTMYFRIRQLTFDELANLEKGIAPADPDDFIECNSGITYIEKKGNGKWLSLHELLNIKACRS